MVPVAAKLLIRILQYFQLADSLFASRESSREFSKVQEVDIQQKLHKHIWGIADNILQVAHDRPCPFSASKN